MSNFASDIVRQFQIIRMIMKEQPEFHLIQNVFAAVDKKEVETSASKIFFRLC